MECILSHNKKNIIILITPQGDLECWAGIGRLCDHYGLPKGTVYQYMSTKNGEFTYKNFKFKKIRVR